MTKQFARYESYKDSGVEWLGQIPVGWNILPGMRVIIENNNLNKGMKESQVLSLSYGRIVIKPLEKLVGLVPESFETYQIVKPNDIIIRCTDLQNDQTSLRTGIATDHGIITSAYLNFSIRTGYTAKYIHYYLHALDISKVLYKFGSGLRQNLSYVDFKRLSFTSPPIEEQKQIADFLDKKTAQIDEAIAQKEKMIELLKEYRQVTINNAVTKGLDPNVPMKDSGIEWLGQIPAHWDVKAIKRICKINPSSKPNGLSKDDLIEFLPMENIDETIGKIRKYNYAPLKNVCQGYTSFKSEDVIFAKITPCMENGNCVIVEKLTHNICYGSTEFIVFRQSQQISNKMLYYFFRNTNFRKVFENNMRGSAGQKRISSDFIGNFLIALAPIEEQKQIADFLDKKMSQFDDAISLKQSEIEKLKEYKATLINSAVTGKIKV